VSEEVVVAEVPVLGYDDPVLGISDRHEFAVCGAVAVRHLRRVDDVVTGGG
jgi:hypothetical protein